MASVTSNPEATSNANKEMLYDLIDTAGISRSLSNYFDSDFFGKTPGIDSTAAQDNTYGLICTNGYIIDKESHEGDILSLFQEEFGGWTVTRFEGIHPQVRKALRNTLRQHGIYTGQSSAKISLVLANLVEAADLPAWDDDELRASAILPQARIYKRQQLLGAAPAAQAPTSQMQQIRQALALADAAGQPASTPTRAPPTEPASFPPATEPNQEPATQRPAHHFPNSTLPQPPPFFNTRKAPKKTSAMPNLTAQEKWIDSVTGKYVFPRFTVENLEQRTIAAAELYKAEHFASIKVASDELQVPYKRLWNRIRGAHSLAENGGNRFLLTVEEEQEIAYWAHHRITQRHRVSKQNLQYYANAILETTGRKPTTSRAWAQRFKKRYPEIFPPRRYVAMRPPKGSGQ